ncbi:diaminopimelate decarboxylase [Streptomyces sp. WMMB 322]|uniref:diaminopimelate decarboxylase n=1 Tax=Streptomyces sp. WMMB 322 TaxID=1286821 RepID=UPI000823F149|nr:diaminopimelate decarboxylase [Streptomyces sp. WMMB 322]SCK11012.1 diaminopimelate decarboxylase [Streptomyces sp. WMMB 322]
MHDSSSSPATTAPAAGSDHPDPPSSPGSRASSPSAGRAGTPGGRAVADGAAVAARRDLAVRAAVEQGLVTEDRHPVAALLDVRAIREAAHALRTAFENVCAPGQEVVHTFAVKAASLVPVLRLLADEGIGCEVASPGELALSRAAGVPAGRTVLDSPAKTVSELREALTLGIALNADNPGELARLDELIAPDVPSPSAVGLRVNPQIGGGSIGAMSTATATSKFGVALEDPGAREWVVQAYRERPWLTRLHSHVGSQGMPLELMAEGARATYELAEEINAAVGRHQVDTLDLGGGLPVNFGSDEITPTFEEYARLLAATVPGLFDGRYGIVTEFGRSLLAKAGTVLTRVEYAKSAGGRPIAVTHAGAQIAVRTVFTPDAWPLRVAAYDAAGEPKGAEGDEGADGGTVTQDIAGPCCFAGDLVARERPLPPLEEGDYAALLDTGAYYFSNPFGYNSLPRPGVYGFTVTEAQGASGGGATGGGVRFLTVREPQSLAEIVAESGGAHRDALRDG